MNNVVIWTTSAKLDLKDIYFSLKKSFSVEVALKIRDEIYESPNTITFPEQFQIDEYRLDCRRIVIRNYKILYQFLDTKIVVVRIFNTAQNPLKSLR